MLRKTTALLGLSVLIVGLLFPLVSFAAGTYKVCEGSIYTDKIEKKSLCCSVAIKKDGTCNNKIGFTDVCYEGIVPCGKPVMKNGTIDGERCINGEMTTDTNGKISSIPCQFCHFFIMIDGIIDYVLIMIVPSLTILVLVIGGVMFYFGGVKPELLSKSKTLFKGVVIGLILIYGSYMIVGIALTILGVANVNPMGAVFDADRGVFKINCQVSMPP